MLVDIAIRALSPAINDPTTAVQALDQIGDLLLRLGRCQLEVGAVPDARGKLRVIVPFPTWDNLLRLAFGEIAVYGATSVQVMRRMLALIANLDAAVRRSGGRRSASGTHICGGAWPRTFPTPSTRSAALSEDRQGLGVTRRTADASPRR